MDMGMNMNTSNGNNGNEGSKVFGHLAPGNGNGNGTGICRQRSCDKEPLVQQHTHTHTHTGTQHRLLAVRKQQQHTLHTQHTQKHRTADDATVTTNTTQGTGWSSFVSTAVTVAASASVSASTIDKPVIDKHVVDKPTATTTTTTTRRLKEFSHRRLDFAKVGLVGRQQEILALDRLLGENGSENECESGRTLALLEGPSGAGKSALAEQLGRKVLARNKNCNSNSNNKNKNALFVSVNFDYQHTHAQQPTSILVQQQPLATIQRAMVDLCSQIVDSSTHTDLRNALINDLGRNQLRTLSKHIHNLVQVVGVEALHLTDQGASAGTNDTTNININVNVNINDDQITYKELSDQLKFVLSRFIEVVTSFHPLVWVLEDLQWADKASMDILQSCLLDTSISSLLVVATVDMEDTTNSTTTNDNGSKNSNSKNTNDNDSKNSKNSKNTNDSKNTNTTNDSKTNHWKETFKTLQSSKQDRSLRIQLIPVSHLSEIQVSHLLSELLNPKDPSTIIPLSKTLHQQTHGNILFIRQLLTSLFEHQLIRYEIGLMKWTWDHHHITNNLHHSLPVPVSVPAPAPAPLSSPVHHHNVIHLFTEKLKKLQPQAQAVMVIAASLGSSTYTYISLIHLILQGLADHSGQATFFQAMFGVHPSKVKQHLSSIIDLCEQEDLIRIHIHSHTNQPTDSHDDTTTTISFVHHTIQQATLLLIDNHKLPTLNFHMGDTLLDYLSPQALQQHLFTVTNFINSKLDLIPNHIAKRCNPRRLQIAQLNHQAAQKAIACSAFQQAFNYFKNAIHLLPNNHWEKHLQLSLNLFSSAAECAFINSDLQQLEHFAKPVLALNCPVVDKARVYHVLMRGAALTADSDKETFFDPIQLGIDALKGMKCKIPNGKIGQTMARVGSMATLSSKVKKLWTSEMFDKLPPTTDPRAMTVMKTLDSLSLVCYAQNPDLIVLVTLNIVKRTFEDGFSIWSPPAFALLALVLQSYLNDTQTATAYAKHALHMVKSMECSPTECRTVSMCYTTVLHWTRPIESCKEPLLKSHGVGMSVGDIESGIWCIFHYLCYSLHTGTPLKALEKDYSTYTRLTKNYKQVQQTWLLSMAWQLVLNVMGQSSNPSILTGEVFNEDDSLRQFEVENDKFMVYAIRNAIIGTAFRVGDYRRAADIAINTVDEYYKALPGQFDGVYLAYAGAVSGYIMYRASKKKKYLKLAQKCREKLMVWTANGCPNSTHFLEMSDGERQAAKGRLKVALQHFQKSIRLASRRGFIQDQAFAQERLAEALILTGDKTNAKYSFQESIRLYGEWGANPKVTMVQARLQQTFGPI